MTLPSNSPGPIQLLNLGNVVTAGFRLYGANLKPYLRIAAVATFWVVLPFLALVPLTVFLASSSNNAGLIVLLSLVWLVLLSYCFAHYLAESALISRLVYSELISQPEPIAAARSVTNSRLWAFFRVALLMGLITLGLVLATYITLTIVLLIPAIFLASAMGSIGASPNGAMFLAIGVLGFVTVIVFLLILLWFGGRLAINELPLAIEPDVTAARSIGRSWNLTAKNAWRVISILLVATLIMLPIQGLVQLLFMLLQAALGSFLPSFVIGTLSLILVLLSNIVIIPFWQAIKAVIYYDLRSRREGLDLTLRRQEPI